MRTTRHVLAWVAPLWVALPALLGAVGTSATAQTPLLPEREPNDSAAVAQIFEGPARISGSLGKGDVDRFLLVVDDDASTQLFDLRFDTSPGGGATATLTTSAGERVLTLATRAAEPTARDMRRLLPPDRYGLEVRGHIGAYTLTVGAHRLRPTVLPTGRERARADRAKNLTEDAAYVLPSGDAWLRWAPGAGRYDVGLAALGEAEVSLSIEDQAGASLGSGARAKPLSALSLGAGDHFIRLRGPEGTLVVLRLAKAGTTANLTAEPLMVAVGQPATGTLPPKGEAHHHVRIEAGGRERPLYEVRASGPGVKSLVWATTGGEKLLDARVEGAGTSAAAVFDHLALSPGDHRFTVVGGPGAYRLEVKPVVAKPPVFRGRAPLVEREPNGGGPFTDELRFGAPRLGFVTTTSDVDTYRFHVAGPVAAKITVSSPTAPIEVRWSNDKPLQRWSVAPGAPLIFRGIVPAGDHELEVSSRAAPLGAPYFVSLELDDPFDPNVDTTLGAVAVGVAVTVKLADTTVAAHHPERQVLLGEVVVTAKQAGTHTLSTRTSDPRWTVSWPRGARVELAAGQRATLPFEVQVAPEAPADRPVRIDLGVLGVLGVGPGASGHVLVDAQVGAPPVRPSPFLPLPQALLGGVDVARTANFVDPSGAPLRSVGRLAWLISGVARRDRRVELAVVDKGSKETPTLRLAGPARVVGVALEAIGPELRTAVSDFSVSLSMDGATWSEAVQGRLEAREGEQAFVLAQPTMAAFARLEVWSSHAAPGRGATKATLGTFKVIADPLASVVSNLIPDLASADHGGHVVATFPYEGWSGHFGVLPDRAAWQVLGFHHGRAAALVALEWEDAKGTSVGERLPGLTFYGSTRGAAGPWTQLGMLAAPGRLALPAPTWVRYLRVEGGTVAKRARFKAPVLRAFELPAGGTVPGGGGAYRSVLGEWGPFARAAGYERAVAAPQIPPPTARGNQSRPNAFRLGAEAVHGRVHRGRVEDWWSVQAPAGDWRLTLRAEGYPTLDVDFELQDMSGQVVPPMRADDRVSFAERRFVLKAGQTYLVRVWQPPSSVVFSWDTSGSVAAWVPLVRNAVQRFAETVTPGQERVHLLPFGGGPLLHDWEERAEHLWSALSGYTPQASSESERALRVATELLSDTRGAKAVVLLTDALSPKNHGLWEALSEVRPRVFTAGVAAGLEGEGQDRLESWASVERGEYAGVTSRGELDVFFERVSARLREPASYTLSATLREKPVTVPGTLEVLDDRGTRGTGAVELVVDVSGSMLEAMRGGRKRIEVAKELLAAAVARDIPAGTPVAVRVFGRVGNDACGTELRVPLGPAASAQAAIAQLDAKKHAMTPIALALEAVGTDLAQVAGDKTVVLITDGRETCGGDPRAALVGLQDKGLNVRVNVVGFALTSAAIKRTFAALAEAGGGKFYDAVDAEGLADVLGAAVRAPFLVRDASGAVVGEGLIGGAPVALDGGVYRVEVATQPPRVFEGVEVRDGESKRLQLSQGK